jgi:hypothetical protein
LPPPDEDFCGASSSPAPNSSSDRPKSDSPSKSNVARSSSRCLLFPTRNFLRVRPCPEPVRSAAPCPRRHRQSAATQSHLPFTRRIRSDPSDRPHGGQPKPVRPLGDFGAWPISVAQSLPARRPATLQIPLVDATTTICRGFTGQLTRWAAQTTRFPSGGDLGQLLKYLLEALLNAWGPIAGVAIQIRLAPRRCAVNLDCRPAQANAWFRRSLRLHCPLPRAIRGSQVLVPTSNPVKEVTGHNSLELCFSKSGSCRAAADQDRRTSRGSDVLFAGCTRFSCARCSTPDSLDRSEGEALSVVGVAFHVSRYAGRSRKSWLFDFREASCE